MLLVLNVWASACPGTKLCVTYFPTHLKLTPFTPVWQRAPVNVVVNNSHWPSAPLTFTCYELIMTVINSYASLISVRHRTWRIIMMISAFVVTQLSSLYQFFFFFTLKVDVALLLLCIVNTIYILVMTKTVLMGKLLLNYFGITHVKRRMDKVWHLEVKLCRITHDAWQCFCKCLILPCTTVTFPFAHFPHWSFVAAFLTVPHFSFTFMISIVATKTAT